MGCKPLLMVLALGAAACGEVEVEALEGGLAAAVRRIDRARVAAAPGFGADGGDGNLGEVPDGYVLVTPLARSGEFGHAVLLLEPESEVVVPIFIGGTEALSIQLRIAGEKFSRPLTHDLFDTFRSRLGVTMVRAQVDALRASVYVGTVVFSRGGQYIRLDSRPSDAIALAIGNKAPIYVSRALLEEAGVGREDLEEGRQEPRGNPVEL